MHADTQVDSFVTFSKSFASLENVITGITEKLVAK